MGCHATANPVVLARREQIADLLRHQAWADGQLERLLRQVDSYVTMGRNGGIGLAFLRQRVAVLAQAMHAAIREYAQVRDELFHQSEEPMGSFQPHGVAIARGRTGRLFVHESHSERPVWTWQFINPAAGCVAISGNDWRAQQAVAEQWTHRSIHTVLSVRAMGEWLAMDAARLNEAPGILSRLREQLQNATRDFWERFSLAETINCNRPDAALHALV
ncbi:MAG TPA: hypothetical protein VFV96_16715 [Verrucomicrobiae bacterium]|nr:hypothetical protein [Verrucomicrobiae bacterium]